MHYNKIVLLVTTDLHVVGIRVLQMLRYIIRQKCVTHSIAIVKKNTVEKTIFTNCHVKRVATVQVVLKVKIKH